jgi:hypothetical protein
MTYLRCTPAIEDIGQDEAETFQRIADTFAPRRQIMRAGMFVCGQMAALRQRRKGETPAQPKAADVRA